MSGGNSAVLSTAGLCGCGRPVRYMTPSGYACNKHMRCLTYEEQGAALRQANTQILNLLALIHRDGGHHTNAVGIERAISDAEQVLYKWRDAYDALELVGPPIEWQGRMDAAVAAERDACAEKVTGNYGWVNGVYFDDLGDAVRSNADAISISPKVGKP